MAWLSGQKRKILLLNWCLNKIENIKIKSLEIGGIWFCIVIFNFDILI